MGLEVEINDAVGLGEPYDISPPGEVDFLIRGHRPSSETMITKIVPTEPRPCAIPAGHLRTHCLGAGSLRTHCVVGGQCFGTALSTKGANE